MRLVSRLFALFAKFIRWYRDPVPGSVVLRVEPATVLAIIALISLATSFWGMGRGMGVEKVSVELSQALRNAPAGLTNQINAAYDNNRMTGYEREAALQRVTELSRVYNNIADIVERKGRDASFNAAAQSLVETLMSYNPGGRAGSLFGVTSNAAQTGQGLDMLFTINSVANSYDEFELIAQPFAQEEAQLGQQINEIMGQDVDSLFRARVKEMVMALSRWYFDALVKNPCNPEKVAEDLKADLISVKWGSHLPVYGAGEKWPTYDAFMDWLLQEARAYLATQDYAKKTMTANGPVEFSSPAGENVNLLVNNMTLSFPLLGGDVSGNLDLQYSARTKNCPDSIINQQLSMTGVFDPVTGFTGLGTLVVSGTVYVSNCKAEYLSQTTPNLKWTGQLTQSGNRCEATGTIVGPDNSANYHLPLE